MVLESIEITLMSDWTSQSLSSIHTNFHSSLEGTANRRVNPPAMYQLNSLVTTIGDPCPLSAERTVLRACSTSSIPSVSRIVCSKVRFSLDLSLHDVDWWGKRSQFQKDFERNRNYFKIRPRSENHALISWILSASQGVQVIQRRWISILESHKPQTNSQSQVCWAVSVDYLQASQSGWNVQQSSKCFPCKHDRKPHL